MNENTTLTTQEVADMLKIAKNTVYELIKRGELNSYRVGKKVRIDLKDVEEYKNQTKSVKQSVKQSAKQSAVPIIEQEMDTIQEPHVVEGYPKQNGFVICGQDIMLDILSRHLQFHPKGVQALRSYVGSYNGLYSLYHGNVQMATAHLWDGDTGEYNTPYVKRMLPGVPAIIVNLACRQQGFYVAKGNPKGITGWADLKRSDISIISREKGSGTRILLDEHLRLLNIAAGNIDGYHRESTSHLAIASLIAQGGADLGMGNEKAALQVNGIDFIPLQKERYDLVIKKEDFWKEPFQAVLDIIKSTAFKKEIEGIGGYDLTQTGTIVGET
ncbi:MAG: excisionase [Anaerocolumna sp.]|jgi:putative molybdopterin biosynthesis protein|nr:excisionase [Anaerocolumna sp.]